jgi:hypothetical protein
MDGWDEVKQFVRDDVKMEVGERIADICQEAMELLKRRFEEADLPIVVAAISANVDTGGDATTGMVTSVGDIGDAHTGQIVFLHLNSCLVQCVMSGAVNEP